MPIRMLVGPILLKLTGRNEGGRESRQSKKGRILILGVLPTLPQLQSFRGSDWLATQVYLFTPCPSAIAREDSALAAMHVCTHARSQLKQPGPAFPPDSPMGAGGLNSLMRWDSQKCIARQRGTAGQSGPETEGAGKPVRGAAPVAGIRHRAAVVDMQTKLSEKNQDRRPSWHVLNRNGQEPGVSTAGTERSGPARSLVSLLGDCTAPPGSNYPQACGKGLCMQISS